MYASKCHRTHANCLCDTRITFADIFSSLIGSVFEFKAIDNGESSFLRNLPVRENLKLKIGAQVSWDKLVLVHSAIRPIHNFRPFPHFLLSVLFPFTHFPSVCHFLTIRPILLFLRR